jgi:hypothetical protein
MLNVYKSVSAFMRGRNLQVNDEVRQVFDRMLATDEQIAQAKEAAGMLPDFEATIEATEKLQARSLRDLKWTVRARGRALKALEKQAADLRKDVEAEVRGEVAQEPVYRAILDAEPICNVIEGMTDQRMLERHGELSPPEALEAAADEAVHNEARARSLATELKRQAEYKSPWDAMRDLRASQTVGVFPTTAGFGSGATDVDVVGNPLMADTGITWPYGSLDGELKALSPAKQGKCQ